MASERIKAESIPWIPIVIITVVLGCVNIVWVDMQTSTAPWYSIGLNGGMLYFMPMPYVLMLILALLSRAKLIRVKPSTFTYIYACVTPLAWTGVADAVYVPGSYWSDRYMSALSMQLEPWFFAPKPEIAQQILTGGVSIPWLEWLPSILWWWLIFVLWASFFISLGTILRRHWVDVEKVPFPQTLVAHELVKITETGKEKSETNSRLLFVGILIGLAFSAILLLILLFPWFPDVLSWRTNTCSCSGATYVTTDSPFAGIVALTGFQKNPLFYAILYLAPLSILFNIWFWSIAVIIFSQIAYALGFYTAAPTIGGCGRGYCGESGVFTNPPFLWAVFGDLGVALGIFFTYWLLNRGYMRETMRAALGRGSLIEAEKNEAISYRTAYAMLLASSVLIVLAFMGATLSLLPALILLFATLFYGFLWARIWGLTGYMSPTGFYTAAAWMKPIWPQPPDPMTMEWKVATGLVVMPASNVAYEGWGHPLLAMTSSYRLASLTGTNPRNVLKITAFAAVLAPILSQISIIWAFYTFGMGTLPGHNVGWWGPTDRFTSDWSTSWPARAGITWWPQMVAGFIVAFALNYLHARYIWFPFDAVGFLLGTDMWSVVPAVWTAALIAWVLKTITLRVGGSKVYEGFGRPIAAGFVIGFSIMCFIGGGIGIIRFFHPF